MPGCVVTVDSFGEEIQLHYLGLFYRKIHIKEGKMEEKRCDIHFFQRGIDKNFCFGAHYWYKYNGIIV